MKDQLSEGWTETLLPELFEINPPKPRQDAMRPATPVSFVPMGAIEAERGTITAPEVRSFGEVRKGYTFFAEGDVIMAKITPCFENGKAAVARGLRNGLGFGSSEFHVFRSTGAVIPEYLFHFVRQQRFREEAAENMTGTAGQARVPVDYMRKVVLPLPPLAEQRRIVARVEALLAQVNRAKARLARAQAILKRFRQAVLGAACSGTLTEDWRYRAGKSPSGNSRVTMIGDELPEGWKLAEIGELFFVDSGEAFKKKDYSSAGLKLFQIANVGFGRTLWEQRNYLPERFGEKYYAILLRDRDIVLALNRPILGDQLKVAMITPSDLPAILYQRVGRLRARARGVAEYGMFYFQSQQMLEQVRQRLQGTDQPYLNTSLVPSIPVPLPPTEERVEIVRRLKLLFAISETTEKHLAAATARAEKLSQAILAKAFSGELVPTEAELARAEGRDYEAAETLLERIPKEGEMDSKGPICRRCSRNAVRS
jgi:type I restriction enzyme S subunit